MTEPPATNEDMAKATQVAQAGGVAASEKLEQGASRAETRQAVDAAADAKAQEVGLKISPEDRGAIADELINRLDSMGAFAPAPVAEPPADTPEMAADAQAAAAGAAQEMPRKRSMAEKFAGI